MDDHTHTIQILVDPAVGPEHGLRAGQILAATERLAYRRRREQGMHGTALISTPRWSVTAPSMAGPSTSTATRRSGSPARRSNHEHLPADLRTDRP